MMNDELNLMRLAKIKRERNEISLLKNKYDLFNKNRFTLNDIQRKRYDRNIKSIRKLIKLVKENFKIPVMAYQVSGEYSLLSNGINKGIIDDGIILENLIAFKRAGANAIISYYADRLDTIIK